MSEDVNPGKVGLVAENLNVQQEESEGVHVSGMALPFGEVSRNRMQYSRESVQEAKDSMVGAAILYNHQEDEVIGHVKSVEVREDGLYYEADLNPNHRFVENNYIERGDISNVSIQAIVEPRSGDTPVVDVQEFLELSMVTVPGFDDADVTQVESVPESVPTVESFVGESVVGEPMGEYDDFEACVQDNQDKEDPEAYCGAIKDATEDVDGVETVPPQDVADNASQVLEAIDDSEYDNDDCGTRTGLERANQLENRESLSADTINRMVSFFARHDGNQEVGDDVDSKWEDCGYVAWQLWGGDAGREWAEMKQEEIEKSMEEGIVRDIEGDAEEQDDPCWDGYTMVGTKPNGNPRCVPDDEVDDFDSGESEESFDDAADVIRMYMEQAIEEISNQFEEENVKISEEDISRGVNSIMSEEQVSDEESVSVDEAVELDSVLSVVERHMEQLMEDLESMEMDDEEEPEDEEDDGEMPDEEEEGDYMDDDEEEEESVESGEDEVEESVEDEKKEVKESADESEDDEESEEVSEEAVSQRGSQMTETESESFKGRIPSLG